MPGLGEASQREKGDAQLPVPNGEVQMWQKGEEGFRVFDMAWHYHYPVSGGGTTTLGFLDAKIALSA